MIGTVGAINGAAPARPGPERRAAPAKELADTASGSSSRALVPLAPSPRGTSPRSVARMSAPFVAQVIATALDAPQTRRRRREEPGLAVGVYGAAQVSAPGAGLRLARAV